MYFLYILYNIVTYTYTYICIYIYHLLSSPGKEHLELLKLCPLPCPHNWLVVKSYQSGHAFPLTSPTSLIFLRYTHYQRFTVKLLCLPFPNLFILISAYSCKTSLCILPRTQHINRPPSPVGPCSVLSLSPFQYFGSSTHFEKLALSGLLLFSFSPQFPLKVHLLSLSSFCEGF
jgi:hypothetical protein